MNNETETPERNMKDEVLDQVKTQAKKEIQRDIKRESRGLLSSLGIRGPLTIESQVRRIIKKIF